MFNQSKSTSKNPWFWVPSLYFAEGIPYVLVMTLSVIFYKRMGISNTDIALYTSWLYLPWVIKPLWSPIVDIFKTKRWWIILMQLMIGVGLAGVAFTIPTSKFMQYTLAFLWLLAFSSATHDIAADGFYMLGLSKHKQAYYIGIRSTFYRLAMLMGQGVLVILAGHFEAKTGLPPVELSVNSISGTDSTVFNPIVTDSLTVNTSLYFISPKELNIGMQKMDKGQAKVLLDSVDAWNSFHGFYYLEDIQKKELNNTSWWHQFVSAPLQNGLKKVFNSSESESISQTTGNMGFAYFYLSKQPEPNETVVLNISHLKGNKSIALAKSYRFEFNDSNWNIPAFVAFQLDAKLNKPVTATFSALSGNITFAWTIVFAFIAIIFVGFFAYHYLILPYPTDDMAVVSSQGNVMKDFLGTFVEFFKKKEIGVTLTFLLVYRLPESQLLKLASPFLLDSNELGGLGLSTGDVGLVYGTVGIIALSLGGIFGGLAAAKKGLKFWLWPMVLIMHLPIITFVYLSHVMPTSLWVIGGAVAVEQFGYGFGFTAYMLYMIYISDGKHKTAHFAITTGFMALGMMLPGMMSGWLQDIIGYQNFFTWVLLCAIPSFIIIPFLKIDPSFGKKLNTKNTVDNENI